MHRLTAETLSLSWIIKYFCSLVFFYTGILWLYRKIKPMIVQRPLRIIAYHAVDDMPNYLDLFMTTEKFEAQMKYLHKNFRINALDEALRNIQHNVNISQDTILITFDDGYKDNYHTLYPIIKKYALPITIFLTSDNIDSGMPTFVYATILLVHNAEKRILDLSEYDLGKFTLDTIGNREKAIHKIDQYSKTLNFDERKKFLDKIISKVGLKGHEDILLNKMLNWEEINDMLKDLVSFGSHTRRHPNLTHLKFKDLHQELAGSKRRIENKIGKKVPYFAYPYGGKDYLNDTVKQYVKKAGYQAAFVLFPDRLTVENKFSLGRKMISNQMTSNPFNRFSKPLFACEISGLFDFLLLRNKRY